MNTKDLRKAYLPRLKAFQMLQHNYVRTHRGCPPVCGKTTDMENLPLWIMEAEMKREDEPSWERLEQMPVSMLPKAKTYREVPWLPGMEFGHTCQGNYEWRAAATISVCTEERMTMEKLITTTVRQHTQLEHEMECRCSDGGTYITRLPELIILKFKNHHTSYTSSANNIVDLDRITEGTAISGQKYAVCSIIYSKPGPYVCEILLDSTWYFFDDQQTENGRLKRRKPQSEKKPSFKTSGGENLQRSIVAIFMVKCQ